VRIKTRQRIRIEDKPHWNPETFFAELKFNKIKHTIIIDTRGFLVCCAKQANSSWASAIARTIPIELTLNENNSEVVQINRAIAFTALTYKKRLNRSAQQLSSELYYSLSSCTNDIVSFDLMQDAIDNVLKIPVTLVLNIEDEEAANKSIRWVVELTEHGLPFEFKQVVLSPTEALGTMQHITNIASPNGNFSIPHQYPVRIVNLGYNTALNAIHKPTTLWEALCSALAPFPHQLARLQSEQGSSNQVVNEQASSKKKSTDSEQPENLLHNIVIITKVLFPLVWNALITHTAKHNDDWQTLARQP